MMITRRLIPFYSRRVSDLTTTLTPIFRSKRESSSVGGKTIARNRGRGLALCAALLVGLMGVTDMHAQTPQTALLADFNHDGIPDALVESSTSPTATIAFGSVPYGTFNSSVKAVTFPAACVSFNSDSLVVGDFNNDNFADIAFFCNGTSGVLLGNGDGTFGAPKTLSGAISSKAVTGDFNKDGKLDIVVLGLTFGPSTTAIGTLQFFPGNGDGTFAAAVDTALDQTTYSAPAVADLNLDGFPDIALLSVVAGVPPSLNIFGNNQNGTFGAIAGGVAAPSTTATVDPSAATILSGSFFGIQTTDLLVAGTGANAALSVFKNTSVDTTYTLNDPVTIPSPGLTGSKAGSFTGSGFTDIAVSNGTSIAVLTNDGAGNFAASYSTLSLASTSALFAVADANGDGYADIFTATLPATGNLQLAVNVTSGSATATSQPVSLSVGMKAISAAWNGNVNFLASGANGTQIVNGASTATSAVSSKNPSNVGDLVTFSATVAPVLAGAIPTGSVVFSDGTTPLSTVSLDGAGQASYSTATLTQGTHAISAAYTGDGYYAPSVSIAVAQVVNHAAAAASNLTWATPAPVGYGTALSAAQLNAVATDATGALIPGTFLYTPAFGTVLDAGARVLSVSFTPTDALSFLPSTKTVTLTVVQASPGLTWATPAGITYGAPLGAAQLNATATGITGAALPGTYTYTPAAGTVLAPGSQTLSVAFIPTNALDYTTAAGSVRLLVSQALSGTTVTSSKNPAVTGNAVTFVATVAPSTASTAVPSGNVMFSDGTTALGTVALTAGSASYTTSTLTQGTHTITAAYAGDTFFTASVSRALAQVVNHAATVASNLTWATPASIVYGTALSATQLNATATDTTGTAIPGSFAYTPAAGTLLDAGTATLSVTFTPTDPLSFQVATKTVPLTVTPATPVLTWATPASITSGVALSATQLNATVTGVSGAALPGTLTYTPPAGTVLEVGTQTLSVTFMPTNALDYTNVSGSVKLLVAPNVGATITAPPTTPPGTQTEVTVALTQPYPIDLTGTLTIGFARSTSPQLTDPSLQFAAGGTTVSFAIPANTTTIPPIQLQAGTIAGTITVPLTLTAGTVDVTPAGLTPVTIVVPPAVPSVSGMTVTRSGDQLTVVMHGFSNTREVANASFHFTAAPGATLGTTDLTLPAATIFNTDWFNTDPSDAYGSTFTYTQIFNTSDGAANIGSVDATLTNSVGASVTMTAK